MKFFAFIVVLITGALLIYGTVDMPDWGDPDSPANTHVSPRYLEESYEKAATPNVVTTVLADYRSYDTTVIFTAGVVCILLLRRSRS